MSTAPSDSMNFGQPCTDFQQAEKEKNLIIHPAVITVLAPCSFHGFSMRAEGPRQKVIRLEDESLSTDGSSSLQSQHEGILLLYLAQLVTLAGLIFPQCFPFGG